MRKEEKRISVWIRQNARIKKKVNLGSKFWLSEFCLWEKKKNECLDETENVRSEKKKTYDEKFKDTDIKFVSVDEQGKNIVVFGWETEYWKVKKKKTLTPERNFEERQIKREILLRKEKKKSEVFGWHTKCYKWKKKSLIWEGIFDGQRGRLGKIKYEWIRDTAKSEKKS